MGRPRTQLDLSLMNRPSISPVMALVPAYRAAEFIQPTLDALSAQTHGALQVLVSVDLCDDATHAICERHAARDPRFRVVRQTERLGWIGNSNFLLSQAQGDYALFAFHDDLLAPTYVAQLAAALDADPLASVAYSDVLLTDAQGRQENWVYTALHNEPTAVLRGVRVLERRGQWWVPNRGLFRLALARQIGGLKTHGAGEFSADWPWVFHLALLGRFVRVPGQLCHKFYKADSLSRSWDFSAQQNFEVHAACMREIWNSHLSTPEKVFLAQPLMQWLAQNRKLGLPAPAA